MAEVNGSVVVAGSVHMDLIARAGRLPQRGETLPGTAFTTHPGGKGGNQVAQVARAGGHAVIVARVGRDDFGERLRAALLQSGVDTTHLVRDEAAATGVSTVLVGADGDYASIIVPGASARVGAEDLDAAAPAIADASVMLLQLEIEASAVSDAAARGRASGATVILNAAPAPARPDEIPSALWRNVDVLVANRGEAEMLAGDDGAGLPVNELATCIRARWGIGTVIVTLGGDGVALADDDGFLHERAWPVDVVETIGAGDAFIGMLAATVARGTSLRDAFPLANAAGAVAVTRSGGYEALPTRSEVQQFLRARLASMPSSARN